MRGVYSIQGAVLLLDQYYSGWKNCFVRGHDEFSGNISGKPAPVHPKQRHCLYNGRKGASAGKREKFCWEYPCFLTQYRRCGSSCSEVEPAARFSNPLDFLFHAFTCPLRTLPVHIPLLLSVLPLLLLPPAVVCFRFHFPARRPALPRLFAGLIMARSDYRINLVLQKLLR